MDNPLTWYCRHDECANCTGGTHERRLIAGETRPWFVECGCECHAAEATTDTPEAR